MPGTCRRAWALFTQGHGSKGGLVAQPLGAIRQPENTGFVWPVLKEPPLYSQAKRKVCRELWASPVSQCSIRLLGSHAAGVHGISHSPLLTLCSWWQTAGRADYVSKSCTAPDWMQPQGHDEEAGCAVTVLPWSGRVASGRSSRGVTVLPPVFNSSLGYIKRVYEKGQQL